VLFAWIEFATDQGCHRPGLIDAPDRPVTSGSRRPHDIDAGSASGATTDIVGNRLLSAIDRPGCPALCRPFLFSAGEWRSKTCLTPPALRVPTPQAVPIGSMSPAYHVWPRPGSAADRSRRSVGPLYTHPAVAPRTALKSGEERFLLSDKTAVIAGSGARPYPQRTWACGSARFSHLLLRDCGPERIYRGERI